MQHVVAGEDALVHDRGRRRATRPVWIVIPNHNGGHWLKDLLPTLEARALAPAQPGVVVLVVDNGSTDTSRALVASQFPWVRWLGLPNNRGFVDATNLGTEIALKAGAESIFWLNSDTRLAPKMLDHLFKVWQSHPEVGVLGPAQTDFAGVPSLRTQALARRAQGASQGAQSTTNVIDVDWVEGSALLVGREVLESIGLLAPLFSPAYFEEVDFCRRARTASFAVAGTMAATVQHAGAGSHANAGPWSKPKRLCERNYLLYHASRPGLGPIGVAGAFLWRAMGHGAKQIRNGQLSVGSWLAAVGAGLTRLPAAAMHARRQPSGHRIQKHVISDADGFVRPTRNEMVAMVLVNYRTPEQTLAAVASLKKQVGVATRILVVDNDSNDHSLSLLQQTPDMEVLAAPTNGGYTAGNNLGIRRALTLGASHVLLVNPDTEAVSTTFVKELVENLERTPVLAAVGPRVYFRGRSTVQNTVLRFPWPVRRLVDYVRARLTGQACRQTSATASAMTFVEALNGVCVLFRADALRDVGLLDEQMFAYVEDIDWAYRAQQKGWRLAFAPVDAIIHWQKTAGYELGGPVDFLLKRNTLYFLRKNGFRLQACAYFAGMVILVGIRWLASARRSANPFGRWLGAFVRVGFSIFRSTNPSHMGPIAW